MGTKDQPVKLALVPGQNHQVLLDNGKAMAKWLTEQTGLHVEVFVPVSYVAVIEALGAKRADAAFINTFGFVLASERYGVRPRLTGMNNKVDTYKGAIIARKGRFKKVEELSGKKFAFVDPSSTSGFLMPTKLFKDRGIKPKETVFAGRHDSVVSMVYQGQVDAGAIFFSPADEEGPQDARKLVKTQYPDVFDKIEILDFSPPIPNDPVAFRSDFPKEIEDRLVDALIAYSQTEEGRATLKRLYNMTEFKRVDDSFYDGIRSVLKELGKTAAEFVK
ncbi:MAG: phosphate/phosphite/phosphonate ABC transporter substrate-binding protein [Bdellovibrionaceae bacterium]|nr:phosphate/phosphite/phosphonate ABC transporter substrate-binding protein [Pseudobdellovibrionaceae bacterium]